jgi:peptidyl-prolyl cis-trans isomerase C
VVKIVVILTACLCFISCNRFRENPSKLVVVDVNGQKLYAGDFARQMAKKLKFFDALAAKDPTNIRRIKESILDDFIVGSLLMEYVEKKGQSVSESDVDQEFEKIRKSYPDDLSFKASFAENGSTPSEWREKLKRGLFEKKAFSLMTSDLNQNNLDKTAHDYYEKNRNEFAMPAEIHIKQMVLSKRDDAERILRAIKSGKNFDELAEKFSLSPDSKIGGDIDHVTKGMVSAFDVGFNMSVGQVSGIISSSYGFHIIKLIGKKAAMNLSYEQAKPRVMQKILASKQQAVFNSWLSNAIKGAKIQKNDGLLSKLLIHTEGNQE